MVEVDGIKMEVYNGFSLTETVGKELQNITLKDADGNEYEAILCRELKKVYIVG